MPFHIMITRGPPNFFIFGAEIAYTLLVIVLCMLVYVRTHEIYSLTKHKGIQFFRYAFMFFGLAYASRLFLYLVLFNTETMFGPFMLRGLMPVSNLVVAFFSTMAILYLAYSTIWKKVDSDHFLTLSNIVALFVGVAAFIYRSPLTLFVIQLLLMAAASAVIFIGHREKARYGTKALYIMIFAFWALSLLSLESRNLIAFEAKIVVQLVSIAAFVAVYLKVRKWVR